GQIRGVERGTPFLAAEFDHGVVGAVFVKEPGLDGLTSLGRQAGHFGTTVGFGNERACHTSSRFWVAKKSLPAAVIRHASFSGLMVLGSDASSPLSARYCNSARSPSDVRLRKPSLRRNCSSNGVASPNCSAASQ